MEATLSKQLVAELLGLDCQTAALSMMSCCCWLIEPAGEGNGDQS